MFTCDQSIEKKMVCERVIFIFYDDKDEENSSRYNIVTLTITRDGRHLITAGGRCVTLWRLFDLTILEKYPVYVVTHVFLICYEKSHKLEFCVVFRKQQKTFVQWQSTNKNERF
jgi:hypothetical protein